MFANHVPRRSEGASNGACHKSLSHGKKVGTMFGALSFQCSVQACLPYGRKRTFKNRRRACRNTRFEDASMSGASSSIGRQRRCVLRTPVSKNWAVFDEKNLPLGVTLRDGHLADPLSTPQVPFNMPLIVPLEVPLVPLKAMCGTLLFGSLGGRGDVKGGISRAHGKGRPRRGALNRRPKECVKK